MSYFLRFVKRFPDVYSLAEAEEDEVLKYWQGLGYYSRARNLHQAAKDIVLKFSGVFPKAYKDILALKGIGEYTAAAICSISYNQPYAVVDGNVFRVLSRLFAVDMPIDTGKGKKYFTEIANEILNPEIPGIHNQAVMEFGALQCTPQSPDCSVCPLLEKCRAFSVGHVSQYPVKQGKVQTRDRYFNYFHVHRSNYTFIKKRMERDIWQGLYEFPLIETSSPVPLEELSKKSEFEAVFSGLDKTIINPNFVSYKHILSHQKINARFYEVYIEGDNDYFSGLIKYSEEDSERFAISRLIHRYLDKESVN